MLVLVCSLFILLLSAPGGWGVRMRNFEVPLHVHRGEQTVLKCEFDLQGERLYSVKWYKGGREFFRYVPNEIPMKQDYNVTGVHVDMEASTGQQVVLQSVTLATSGRYKCEVLAEAPAFNTLVEHAILTVVDIPQEKPVVHGAQERYHPGDMVRINCTSAPSKPAATLTWYINDKVAPNQYLTEYLPYMQMDGLEQSTLGLHFQATHDHFPHNLMSLRCTASIGIFYNETEEASLETHRPALSLQSREHFFELSAEEEEEEEEEEKEEEEEEEEEGGGEEKEEEEEEEDKEEGGGIEEDEEEEEEGEEKGKEGGEAEDGEEEDGGDEEDGQNSTKEENGKGSNGEAKE